MNSDDSFYKKFSETDIYSKLYDKKERFGGRNTKTIGLLLVSKKIAQTILKLLNTKVLFYFKIFFYPFMLLVLL